VPPNKAVFKTRYAILDRSFYNTLGSTLEIGASVGAIERVIAEARAALTPRDLRVIFTRQEFFGGAGTMLEPEYILPYWADYLAPGKSQTHLKHGDEIQIEWSFDIASLLVCPNNHEGEFEHAGKVESTSQVWGDVGVFLATNRDEETRKNIAAGYRDALAALIALRSPLYLGAIALVLIALKLWFQTR
jgi:hypothetical protein